MGSHDPFGHLKHKLWPKEGSKSNRQFDSRPLKVRNHLDFLACRWHATNCWKALEECHNFVLDLISIEGFHTKLWGPKIMRVSTLAILRHPLGSPRTKNNLDVGLMEKHIIYYKGKGGGFPQVQAVVSLMSLSLPMVRLSTKSAPIMQWPPCIGFVQVHVNSWCLSFFLVPSWNSSTPFYPSKCFKLGSVPQLLAFSLSSIWTHIWVH